MVGGYFEQELEYVLCMGPLVLAMWAMPTLHEAVTGQCSGGRQTLFSPAEMLQMHGRWMLNKPALQSGEWWRAVTHMFVHKDMDHLLQNLRGMLANGFVAFSEFGWQGPYGVFFCSGILAGLNTPGRAFQTEAQLEGSLPRVPDRLGPVAIPETARGWWDALRHRTAQASAPLVEARTEGCGASAGVSGLMGFGLGTFLYQLWEAESYGGRGSSRGDGRRRDARQRTAVESMASLLNLVQSAQFLAEEWRSMKGEAGLTGVDHVGHLTGFGVGFALALLSKAWWPQLSP
ncbi:hypothetical protein AK812_SmicGene11382 [Symbiodinium microadriaticum]|uniref:Peptidase S54 rhomboid domain-containing protein n=1 Tax=Symbiodinium microadriaticum TaxID=2951 RepID=A0A1Q9EDB8_SYMMI|nr:hypothetical protein AK812_SmicGene11382 [Symbiodinium microadriaticum]